MESLLTELAVVAAMRTHKPMFQSLPSPLLFWTTLVVAVVSVVIVYSPVAPWFGFAPLPVPLLATILLIVAGYVAATELLKTRISPLAPARPVAGVSVGA